MQPPGTVLFVVGQTASGKGSVGLELARTLDGEILSLDSMKVFRAMNVGTGTALPDRRRGVPFHLVDVVEPEESFSVVRYLELALAAVGEIVARFRVPIFAGGTPLYLHALLRGIAPVPPENPPLRERLRREVQERGARPLHDRLAAVDPERAAQLHPNDVKRVIRALEIHDATGETFAALTSRPHRRLERPARVLGLRRAREDLDQRIAGRADAMLAGGLLAEGRALAPRTLSRQAAAALGYPALFAHLRGEITLDELRERLVLETRQFAKRQMVFLRRFAEIEWIDVSPAREAADVAREILSRRWPGE